MKIFTKILAVFAVLLILLSLTLLLVTTVFQVEISTALILPFGRRDTFLEKNPVIPIGTFLACILEILFVAPMIFLAGRKRGGIWVEIGLLLLMLLTIPVTKALGDFLGWYIVYGINRDFSSIGELFYNYYYWWHSPNPYVTNLKSTSIIYEMMSRLNGPAEFAQILAFIVYGISMGLRLKDKKAKRQMAASAPDVAVCA